MEDIKFTKLAESLIKIQKREKRSQIIALLLVFMPLIFGFSWVIYTSSRVSEIKEEAQYSLKEIDLKLVGKVQAYDSLSEDYEILKNSNLAAEKKNKEIQTQNEELITSKSTFEYALASIQSSVRKTETKNHQLLNQNEEYQVKNESLINQISSLESDLDSRINKLRDINIRLSDQQDFFESLRDSVLLYQNQLDILVDFAGKEFKSSHRNEIIAKAKATPLNRNDIFGRTTYSFKLWVEQTGRRDEITSVDYNFNHRSFIDQKTSSNNPDNNFEVGYKGWGCLQAVIITIKFRNMETREIFFNMCERLEVSDDENNPIKKPIMKKGD